MNGGPNGLHNEDSGTAAAAGIGQLPQQQQQQQHGRASNGSTSAAGDGGRLSFSSQHPHPSTRPSDSAQRGQHPYQHVDSSLLTLASISHPSAGPNGHVGAQPPPAGTIGSPRTMLSGLDLLNATLAQATLGSATAAGATTSPTLATRAPQMSASQTSPARLPTAPHLSPPTTAQPHRPSFPVSSQSSSGLFATHQSSRLIPPASSGASSNGGNGTGGASPFSTSPFAAPGSRSLFLSSSYDTYAQERDGAFPSSLPALTLRPAGTAASRHLASARTRSFLDGSSMADGGASSADEDAFHGADDEDDEEGEEFLPSSLSELLTEHEMERRMTRRNSNQPHLQRPSFSQHAHSQQQLGPGHGTPVSASATAAFPISRLHSDGGLYTKSAGPWIESVPSLPAGGQPAVEDTARTISRRHSERPPAGSVFDAFGVGRAGEDGSLPRSPPVPQAMFDSTHTLRPNAFGSGAHLNNGSLASSSFDEPFRHPSSMAPSQAQPARSNLAALWDRSSASSFGGAPSSVTTQTRHGFQLSSSPNVAPPLPPTHQLGTTHQPSHQRHLPAQLVSGRSTVTATQPLMSPSSRALASHAPGMSLPGGLGVTLSRLHFQPAGTPGEGTSYSSNGLPDLAGLAFGTVSRHQEAAAATDPWRSLDGDGFPPLGGGGGDGKIHQPTPIKTGATIATRAEEEDEFADDVLFE